MPSEMIYSGKQDINVRVAWGREDNGAVQVATLVRRTDAFDPTQRVVNIVNEWLVAAGMPEIDLAEVARRITERTPEGQIVALPYFDGYHATLDDWSAANTLIRVLKRARDTSFGRPE